MKIENSKIVLSSNSSSIRQNSGNNFKEIYSKLKDSFQKPVLNNQHLTTNLNSSPAVLLFSKASNHTRDTLIGIKNSNTSLRDNQTLEVDIDSWDKRKIQLLQQLLEKLTGKKVKFYLKGKSPADIDLETFDFHLSNISSQSQVQQTPLDFQSSPQSVHTDKNIIPFTSEGTIKTTDGKEIKFTFQTDLNRGSISLKDTNPKQSTPVDPLIINFDSVSAALTDQKFNFDLNADGKTDKISFTSQGSGFLALDSNNDDIINNGTELFGATSGNGFSELTKFDADSNNWIDENDAVFEKLKIWSKDSQGSDILSTLKSKGIGAIFLGNVETPVKLAGVNGETQGEVRRTGVFVREDGTAGTIQHVDLNT